MPISVTCPACGSTFADPDELAGKPATCPTCGELIAVAAREDVAAPPGQEHEQASSRPENPSVGGAGAKVAKWVVSLIVCVLVLIVLRPWLDKWGPRVGPVNKRNYEKIHNGMTKIEVEAILGKGDMILPGAGGVKAIRNGFFLISGYVEATADVANQ
jgi:hypothetical protein